MYRGKKRYFVFLETGKQFICNFPANYFRIVSSCNQSQSLKSILMHVNFYRPSGQNDTSIIETQDLHFFGSDFFDRVEITNLGEAGTFVFDLLSVYTELSEFLFTVSKELFNARTFDNSVSLFTVPLGSFLVVKNARVNYFDLVPNGATWIAIEIGVVVWVGGVSNFYPIIVKDITGSVNGSVETTCDLPLIPVGSPQNGVELYFRYKSSNGLSTASVSKLLEG